MNNTVEIGEPLAFFKRTTYLLSLLRFTIKRL